MKAILRYCYLLIQWSIRLVGGTRVDELKWENRCEKDVQLSLTNISLPHRKWLLKQMHLDHTEIILELGCGWGPNLITIAKEAPNSRLVGIDINKYSVRLGKTQSAMAGLTNIEILLGHADDLSVFTDNSFDIVFSDATLLYIGPDKISLVISEMIRLARKQVFLLEFHKFNVSPYGRYTKDGWLRDYSALLKSINSEISFSIIPLPTGLRPEGRWPSFGTLIKIDCSVL